MRRSSFIFKDYVFIEKEGNPSDKVVDSIGNLVNFPALIFVDK